MTYIKIVFVIVFLMLEKCHFNKKQTFDEGNSATGTEQNNQSADLTGSWLLADIKADHSLPDAEDGLLADANQKKDVRKGLVISFFSDSTFTKIDGDNRYRSGKYSFDDQILTLKDDRKAEEKLVIFGTDGNNRRTIRLKSDDGQQIQTFSEYALPLDRIHEDPFYAKNNQWRIKPIGKENETQLEARLINYIQHNCYILKAATDRKQAMVSWQFSEGIIKIYNGGIGTVPIAYIPRPWINCFYSETDAMKAYHLFESYLRTNSYKGASTGEWVKDDYDILVSIYAHAKERQEKDVKNTPSSDLL